MYEKEAISHECMVQVSSFIMKRTLGRDLLQCVIRYAILRDAVKKLTSDTTESYTQKCRAMSRQSFKRSTLQFFHPLLKIHGLLRVLQCAADEQEIRLLTVFCI